MMFLYLFYCYTLKGVEAEHLVDKILEILVNRIRLFTIFGLNPFFLCPILLLLVLNKEEIIPVPYCRLLKWPSAKLEHIEEDPACEDIYLLAIVLLPEVNFGRFVGGGAYIRIQFFWQNRVKVFCEPKIGQDQIEVDVKEGVLRLDVSMSDSFRVAVLNGRNQLLKEKSGGFVRKAFYTLAS